ncbi:carbon-nitrogen hydrolase family protein [Candidatus Woesearchaeota archaeon]|nr:carbon-nitrogen hydrolase family protein [Candidatus Woesearchaeota archaeon]
MGKAFKIAAVQLNISKPIDSVIKDIRKFMHLAKGKRVDIICFPEDSISLGPKKNKLIISQVMECCKLYGIWCIISTHLKEKKYHYNSALLIDSDGNLCGKHKKVHLQGDGPNIFPGSKFDIYKTPFCKIGIAICWDVSNPMAMKRMAKKGAKIIFCPMYWCYDDWAHKKNHKKFEKKILKSLILTRAYESLVYVVFCNPIDLNEKYLTSYTAIAEPHKIIKEMFNKEGMITAKIDLDYLRNIRKKWLT